MPSYRKPQAPHTSRPEGAPLPSDSGDFSIESTTMRLKSMRLRRAEREDSAAEPPASTQSGDSLDMPRGGPSGRVRHDERGVAVWDWAVATGEFAALSATRALKKLEVSELSIEETVKTEKLSLAVSGRDKGGGFDPYNQRGSGRREGEAASRQGVTGAADRDRGASDQSPGNKK
jgi:hypothetical protein